MIRLVLIIISILCCCLTITSKEYEIVQFSVLTGIISILGFFVANWLEKENVNDHN